MRLQRQRKRFRQPSGRSRRQRHSASEDGDQDGRTGKKTEKAFLREIKKKKSAKKIWRNILIVLLVLVAAAGISIYVLYNTNRMDISGMTYSPKEKTKIMSADNVQIAELYSENRGNAFRSIRYLRI